MSSGQEWSFTWSHTFKTESKFACLIFPSFPDDNTDGRSSNSNRRVAAVAIEQIIPVYHTWNRDSKVGGLNGNDCYTLGYADEIAILICGKFPNTVPELPQEGMSVVQQRCDRTQLSTNPQKIATVPFIQKSDLRGLKEPTLPGHTFLLNTEIRYLVLILDKGWTWNLQLKNVKNKAYRAFWTSMGIFCNSWGLKPRVVYWNCTMVIRCNVSRTELNKLQR